MANKPIICFLCGDEIPSGWPVTFHHDDTGNLSVVHRFRNMCATGDQVAESNEKGDKKK